MDATSFIIGVFVGSFFTSVTFVILLILSRKK